MLGRAAELAAGAGAGAMAANAARVDSRRSAVTGAAHRCGRYPHAHPLSPANVAAISTAIEVALSMFNSMEQGMAGEMRIVSRSTGAIRVCAIETRFFLCLAVDGQLQTLVLYVLYNLELQ